MLIIILNVLSPSHQRIIHIFYKIVEMIMRRIFLSSFIIRVRNRADRIENLYTKIL